MIRFLTERLLQNNHSCKIMDYGCGIGEGVIALAKAGFAVVGADIEPKYVRIARSKCAGMGVDRGKIVLVPDGQLPFPSASFDCIYSNTVLEHVRDVGSYLGECQRLLKPSGIIFATMPVRFSLMEEHIPLPLAHWLPPGRLRRCYIRALAREGVHELGRADLGRYFDGYISRLNYWSPATWKAVFRQYFRRVEDVTLEKKGFEAERLATLRARIFLGLLRLPRLAPALRGLVRLTTTMNLVATEPRSKPAVTPNTNHGRLIPTEGRAAP